MIARSLVSIGCDPEVFLQKDNKVVGSERAIPLAGLDTDGAGSVVRDGVQVEINPSPDCCRAFLINNISSCFKALRNQVSKTGHDISFARRVKVEREEILQLTPEARQLGCAPSLNHDTKVRNVATMVRGRVTKSRSAGGHIHLGFRHDPTRIKWLQTDTDKLAMIMDVVLGNICVIMDTDPSNVTRRKLYGRAGEYRSPSHGFEYRTLSNFWLHHEAVASLIFGIARDAASVHITQLEWKRDEADQLLSLVNIDDVKEAINKNNQELAWSNWNKIIPFFLQHGSLRDQILNSESIPIINHFMRKGFNHWFDPETHNILDHWCNLPEGHGIGWGNFANRVRRDMQLEKLNEPRA